MKTCSFVILALLSAVPLCSAFVAEPVPPDHQRCRSVERTARRATARDGTAPDVFPVSTRAMLVEKAKQRGYVTGSDGRRLRGTYSSAGWSNRLGSVLTPASIPGVYTADRPFYWNKIDVGCRMTVVQLDDNELFVHSPVGLDADLRRAIDELGTVRYVVSPNYEHVSYASMWAEAYPDAFMWACPGLAERMPGIEWEGEIPAGIVVSSEREQAQQQHADTKNCWDLSVVQPMHVDVEANPFTGKPFFNEVVFYHAPSKTLMVTDLYWNYPAPDGTPRIPLEGNEPMDWELAPPVDTVPVGSRLWKFGMDRVYHPFYMNFMVKDTQKYDRMVDVILNEWDVETIVPAHGDLIHGRKLCRRILEKHLKRQ